MTYSKPYMRYVDMAKYIDDNAYEEDCNHSLIYEYIYHLANMLAHKSKFFKTSDTYDYFSLYCANRFFLKLSMTRDNRIKSCLNYLKKVLYFYKVDFEQENYAQVISENSDDICEESLRDKINKTVDTIHIVEFEASLHNICDTIKGFLKNIEYKQSDPMWHKIYMSCLLSFLSSITLSNKNKERLSHLDDIGMCKDYLLEDLLAEENDIILYHIDSSMYNYIRVLLNRIKHLIALDLCSNCKSYISSSANMKSLLLDSLECGEDE